jgi:hypothetical protein
MESMEDGMKDGGPAFPAPRDALNGEGPQTWRTTHENGMSLRDYFAAKAMQGLISGVKPFSPYDPEDIVSQAYATADAMLKEREK